MPPLKTDGKRPKGSATSHDVARRAGVSQSAVSRCCQPTASISEAMRRKVLAAATKQHYAPNANRLIADRLYRGGHRRFAFIAGALDAPVSAQRLHDFVQRLGQLMVRPAAVLAAD